MPPSSLILLLYAGIKTLLRPGHRWKAVLLVVLACAGLLAGGLLIGYATGRKKAAAGQQSVGQLEAGSMKLQQQLMHAGQLPFPGSAAAVQLLADPSVPGESKSAQWLVVHSSSSSSSNNSTTMDIISSSRNNGCSQHSDSITC